jgi:hypothetical protein
MPAAMRRSGSGSGQEMCVGVVPAATLKHLLLPPWSFPPPTHAQLNQPRLNIIAVRRRRCSSSGRKTTSGSGRRCYAGILRWCPAWHERGILAREGQDQHEEENRGRENHRVRTTAQPRTGPLLAFERSTVARLRAAGRVDELAAMMQWCIDRCLHSPLGQPSEHGMAACTRRNCRQCRLGCCW